MTAAELHIQPQSQLPVVENPTEFYRSDLSNPPACFAELIQRTEKLIESAPQLSKPELISAIQAMYAHLVQATFSEVEETTKKAVPQETSQPDSKFLQEIRTAVMDRSVRELLDQGWYLEESTRHLKHGTSVYLRMRRNINGRRTTRYIGTRESCKRSRN